jgi:hypothetical protein
VFSKVFNQYSGISAMRNAGSPHYVIEHAICECTLCLTQFLCINFVDRSVPLGVGSDPREDRYFNVIKQVLDTKLSTHYRLVSCIVYCSYKNSACSVRYRQQLRHVQTALARNLYCRKTILQLPLLR